MEEIDIKISLKKMKKDKKVNIKHFYHFFLHDIKMEQKALIFDK